MRLLLAGLLVFVLVNWIIWKCWTEQLLSPRFLGGDLTRLGYIAGIKKPRLNTVDLPAQHVEMKDFRGGRVDMVTVGDSFSIGGGDGRNRYYQDYIASINGMSVLNVPTYKFSSIGAMPVSTLAVLYNSGFLDRVKPRYVLLQTVERYAVTRLVSQFGFDETAPLAEIEQYYRKPPAAGAINQGLTFINEGNFKVLYYRLMYNFSEHAFRKLVIKTEMNKALFSGPRGATLLVHGDDVQQIPHVTVKNIRILNDNLNRIALLLREKGIELVFMPVVDKLNLYRPYLKKNNYPRSIFFEELRKLPHEYRLIDTKAILAAELAKGELDLFHQDDTHWTWKAAERVFSTERFAGSAEQGK